MTRHTLLTLPAGRALRPRAITTVQRSEGRVVGGLAAAARLRAATGLVVIVAAALGACAATPRAPSPEMVRAEVTIAQAQKSGAADLANDSLQAAQHKLDGAKASSALGDLRLTQDLAEESLADAELADYTAQSIKSAKSAEEVEKGLTALKSEANRRSPQ